jgi:hypothetical protein
MPHRRHQRVAVLAAQVAAAAYDIAERLAGTGTATVAVGRDGLVYLEPLADDAPPP